MRERSERIPLGIFVSTGGHEVELSIKPKPRNRFMSVLSAIVYAFGQEGFYVNNPGDLTDPSIAARSGEIRERYLKSMASRGIDNLLPGEIKKG